MLVTCSTECHVDAGAEPIVDIYKGKVELVLGRMPLSHEKAKNPAVRLLERGIKRAKELDMPFVEALGHFELCRRPGGGSRVEHTNKAKGLFVTVGAQYYVRLLETPLLFPS